MDCFSSDKDSRYCFFSRFLGIVLLFLFFCDDLDLFDVLLMPVNVFDELKRIV